MAMSNPQIMEIAVRRVRQYIRDTKELNKLLGGKYENDDPAIRQAIMDALFDWNVSLPPLGFIPLDQHPAPHLLIRKATVELIKSAGLWHSREHLPSSDGGTSADDHAKIGEYMQWMQYIDADYERKKTELKVAINISQGYGGVGSEYYYDWRGWDFSSTDLKKPMGDIDGGKSTTGGSSSAPSNGGNGPVTNVIEDSYAFAYNQTSPRVLALVPHGYIIFNIKVLLDVVFNGTSPILIVGDSANGNNYVSPTDSDLTIVGSYTIDLNRTLITDTNLYISTIASGATQGRGHIVITRGAV